MDKSLAMIDPHPAAPKWVKIVFRTVGTVNAVLALLGAYFAVHTGYGILIGRPLPAPDLVPQVRFAFAVMTLINLVFVSSLLVTAIGFLKGNLSAANSYSLLVLLLLGYWSAIRKLWRIGRGIATIVAAATGIGNLGIAPFVFLFLVPFLYPVVSMIVAQVLKQRYRTLHIPNQGMIVAGNTTFSSSH